MRVAQLLPVQLLVSLLLPVMVHDAALLTCHETVTVLPARTRDAIAVKVPTVAFGITMHAGLPLLVEHPFGHVWKSDVEHCAEVYQRFPSLPQ